MADFGATNNATTIDNLTGSSSTYYIVGGSSFSGGDITGMFSYCANSGTGGVFNDTDWAIYSGGSASNPSGATLVAQSKHYGASVSVGGDTSAWRELFSTGTTPITASGVAAGYLWFVMRSQGIVQGLCDDADAGDLNQHTTDTASAGSAGAPGAAWPSAFPSAGSATGSGTMKIRITYTSYTVDQAANRAYNDDGSESAMTAMAAQNTNVTVALNTNVIIRSLLQAVGNPDSIALTLRGQKNGSGGYVAVPVGGSVSEAYGTVSYAGAGTAANGGTTVAPAHGSPTAGWYALAVITSGATNSETPTAPDESWSQLATGASTDGSFGVDTGPRRVTVFGKQMAGSEGTGTETFSITNGNTCRGQFYYFSKAGSGAWAVEAQGGNDSTSGTDFSATLSSMNWNTGDATLVAVGQRVDTVTQSSQSLTASGVTFGTRTNRATTAVTTGNDHRHVVDTFAAITSTSNVNAAPTWAYTGSAACSGGVVVVRLREYTAPATNECFVSTSSNITAGGEATTQRLTGGTGSFTAGVIADNINPLTGIDPGNNDNTEVAMCVQFQSPAAGSDYWDFRWYIGNTPLASYTNTLRVTISSGEVASVTGVAGTGAVGSLSVSGLANTSVTGVAATGAVGTLTASETAADTAFPSGVAGSGQVGTLAPPVHVDIDLIGTEAVGEVGSLSLTWTGLVVPTGVQATGQVGSLSASGAANTSVTGVEAAGQVGSLSASLTTDVALTGVEASGQVGALTQSHESQVALTGVSASGAVGALTQTHESVVALSGVQATSAVGSVEPSGAASASVSGVSATGAVGALSDAHDSAIAITGVGATGSVGTLTTEADGSTSVSPPSVQGVASVGTITFTLTGAAAPLGVESSTSVGVLLATGNGVAALFGVEATAAIGALSANSTSSTVAQPQGVEAVGSVGSISSFADSIVSLIGVAAVGYAGTIAFGVRLPPAERVFSVGTGYRIHEITYSNRNQTF